VTRGSKRVALVLVATVLAAVSIDAPLQAARSPVAAAPVPSSLKTLESSAEDLVDFALSRDRGAVAATAAKLTGVARGPAAASLTRSGVAQAKIARLQRTANRVARIAADGSFIRVALAANAVSGLMPDLYAHFHDRVPPAVLALDYLDREAQLRSLARERKRVGTAVQQLVSTWTRLRPKVLAAGGGESVAAFDKHVAAMKRLVRGAPSRVQGEAIRGLALVDRLEQVFTR
jgi:hypothetical protein